ncbi:MAG: YceI family protein [Shewanella sp.]
MNKWTKLALCSAMISFHSAAQWQVIEQGSRVSFVSVKKGDIGEVHYFKQLKGTLKDNGQFELSIPLASVATGISVRDERMQDMLFEVALYPQLKLTSQVDNSKLHAIKLGETQILDMDAKIELHGKSQTKKFAVMVTKVSAHKLLVNSLQPIIVNADEFALVAGLDKLRGIAGLSAISQAVPVSFVLTLIQ